MSPSRQTRKLPDITLVLTILALLVFGVIMVYDASVVYASDLFAGKYYFLILQSFWVVLAFGLAQAAALIDYHHWRSWAAVLMIFSFLFLLLLATHVVLPKSVLRAYEVFVPKINGAYRWFYFNPKPLPNLPLLGRLGFQPSELAKVALVIYLASLLSGRKKVIASWRVFSLVGFLGLLIVIQPDFGTAFIIVGSSFIIFYLAGISSRKLLLLCSIVVVLGSVFILTSPYRRQRLLTYIRGDSSGNLTNRYQINQIMIALGSGGLTGLGMGRSVQKYGYIPEVSTDSIFAVVGEEFGFVGTSLMVGLFFLLIYRSFWVANRAPDDFGRLLASGIIGFISLQVFVNLFSMTHLIPLTGVPLPLISYGGSSLVVNLMALGIILNISRQATVARKSR